MRIALISVFVLSAGAASAQSMSEPMQPANVAPGAPATAMAPESGVMIDPQALQDIESEMLRGGRLLTEDERAAYEEPVLGDSEDVYVINESNAKDAGDWTEADSRACEASGGVVLPLPANRIACFRL